MLPDYTGQPRLSQACVLDEKLYPVHDTHQKPVLVYQTLYG